MTDAALGGEAAKVSSRYFYAWMAMTCFAIAVIGFMPTYFVPLAQGQFKSEPVVHIHGLILFAWVSLFVTQTWLVAKGGTLAHRSWGMLGVAIMGALTIVVLWIVSMRLQQATSPGIPAQLTADVRAFEWVTVSGLLFIVPCFILAIVKLKQAETHKRLMLLLTISMLGAPIARWFLVFLAPPPDPNAPVYLLPNGLPAPAVPPVEVAVPPALIGDILWIIAMIYDWRTQGRVHPVYIFGGGIMLLLQVTVGPVGHSAAWQAVAGAIGHLMG
jgi:hypothetical protein